MRGEITITNYEAWLLDRLEGNLSDEEIRTLENFLIIHPELDAEDSDLLSLSLPFCDERMGTDVDLKKEFEADHELILNYLEELLTPLEKEAFETRLKEDTQLLALLEIFKLTKLTHEVLVFPKSQLLKSEEDVLLASPVLNFIEQQLSPQEQNEFLATLPGQANLKTELALFEATRLQADPAIVYPNKSELMRGARILPLFSLRTWQYAAAILLLLVFSFLIRFTYNPAGDKVQTLSAEVLTKPAFEKPASAQEVNSEIKTKPVLKRTTTIKKGTELAQAGNDKSLNRQSLASKKKKSATNEIDYDRIISHLALTDSLALANPSALASESFMKYYSVEELEETEDLPELELAEKKTDLWHKAVDLARRVNKMGFTAVNGAEEQRTRSYRLSFNSFSVEKK